MARMERVKVRAFVAASFVALTLLAAPVSSRAAKLTEADKAWIAKCVRQLAREHPSERVLRKYCTCMHEMFEDNDDVSQSDMEHMYPPLHRSCNKSSGWK